MLIFPGSEFPGELGLGDTGFVYNVPFVSDVIYFCVLADRVSDFTRVQEVPDAGEHPVQSNRRNDVQDISNTPSSRSPEV